MTTTYIQRGDFIFRIDWNGKTYSAYRLLYPSVNGHQTTLIAEELASYDDAYSMILAYELYSSLNLVAPN